MYIKDGNLLIIIFPSQELSVFDVVTVVSIEPIQEISYRKATFVTIMKMKFFKVD